MLYYLPKKSKHKIIAILTFVFIFTFAFPQSKTLANIYLKNNQPKQISLNTTNPKNKNNPPKQTNYLEDYRLPKNKIKVKKIVKVVVTAYNAVPEQTDSTPCITADGTNICANPNLKIVAANWLPFGTKIRIPEYFGNTIFEVRDRMNSRYPYRVDVLMDSIPAAKKFGVRYLKIEIIG